MDWSRVIGPVGCGCEEEEKEEDTVVVLGFACDLMHDKDMILGKQKLAVKYKRSIRFSFGRLQGQDGSVWKSRLVEGFM